MVDKYNEKTRKLFPKREKYVSFLVYIVNYRLFRLLMSPIPF